MPNCTLQTDRLILRPFREDDLDAVQAYASVPEVCRYMTWGPNDEEQTRGFIRRVMAAAEEEPRLKHDFAVTLKADGQLIGGSGLYLRSDRKQGFIGYVLHADHWGNGYATELARELVRFGFGDLGMHRIFATCDAENLASARVLQKAGMRREGLMLKDVFQKGDWRDTLHFAILNDEWRANRD